MSSSSKESWKTWSLARTQSSTSGHPLKDRLRRDRCPSEREHGADQKHQHLHAMEGQDKVNTQVCESSVVDHCVAHVYFFKRRVFVIQKVPTELALLVCTEPFRLANVPEDATCKQSITYFVRDTVCFCSFTYMYMWVDTALSLDLLVFHMTFSTEAEKTRHLPKCSLHTQDIIRCCDVLPIVTLGVAIVTVSNKGKVGQLDKHIWTQIVHFLPTSHCA